MNLKSQPRRNKVVAPLRRRGIRIDEKEEQYSTVCLEVLLTNKNVHQFGTHHSTDKVFKHLLWEFGNISRTDSKVIVIGDKFGEGYIH